MQAKEIAKFIDHTLLKPNASKAEIEKLCQEAIEYGFKAVCVNPGFIKLAAELLKGTDVLVVTVVDFPLGSSQSSTKAFEAREAIADGAQEIDMVMNISALKAKDYEKVVEDIKAVVDEASPLPVKVILETCYLTKEEKVIAAALAQVAGASFVKTSTGFAEKGATEEDIALLHSIVGGRLGIKASGGIRTLSDALKMIKAGATRLGVSKSLDLMKKK